MADEDPITLHEGNDETVELIVDRLDSDDDLTTVAVLQFFLKHSRCDSDNDATTIVLTSADPTRLRILTQSAAQITAEVYVPASALAGSFSRWYRLDGVSATGARRTALYGPVTVVDL